MPAEADAAGWLEAAADIAWDRAPEQAFRLRADGMADWFPDGRLNVCANALDRHVEAGRGERIALVWDSPVTATVARLSFATLRDRTARLAGGLRALGVGPGDRVLISMPPVPEAVIAMLACARLGAVHVVVFTGFSAGELAARIDDTTPVAVVSASCFHVGSRPVPHLPVMRDALATATHRPSAWVLLDRTPDGDAPAPPPWLPVTDYRSAEAAEPVDPVVLPATAPLYILHSSGTTGHPKGIVRDCGGHAVAMQRSMRLVYRLPAGGVFCTTADLGWVVGHSYGVYGPLIAGCTTVLYEGGMTGTPDAGALWRLCAAHRVDVLFTSPSALRAVRAVDPGAVGARAHDLHALRSVFLAGERADPALLDWGRAATGVPVQDHWWQTESGWCIAGPGDGSHRSAMTAMPGFALRCLDAEGQEQAPGAPGELVLRLPLPPGCLAGLWRGPAGLEALYLREHPGYFRTFDYGRIDADGGVTVLSRVDDVIKVAGRLVATGPIEDVLMAHPDVVDCAVVGEEDPLRGQRPVAHVVPSPGLSPARKAQLRCDLIESVRSAIGGFCGLRRIVLCTALPRTRSGKVVRRTLARDAVEG